MFRSHGQANVPKLGVDFDPAEPLPAHNTITIRGWAIAPDGIDSVRVGIAGRELTASYGLPAPEWLTDLPDWPDARYPCFELALPADDWERGLHTFEIVATSCSGVRATLAGEVDAQPYQQPPLGDEAVVAALAGGAPAMWCEAPDVHVERTAAVPVEIAGWAASPAGIESVIVTIDGRRRLEALHGMVRPDLRARLGDTVATGGFAIHLDPAECPPGWHELTVVAIAADGRAVGVSGVVNCRPAAPLQASGEETEDPLADVTARKLGEAGERFVPVIHREMALAPEHYARYGWAAPMAADAVVLDAGCGIGWGTAMLARHARRVVGIDLSPAAVAEAARQHGDRAEFREGDLLSLPFPDGEFDVAVCFEAIEHVADPEAALDELRRVLSKDGLLLVSSPNRGVFPEGNPFHLRELTSAELTAGLKARFANVVTNRQQTYYASLLGDDSTLLLDDPDAELGAHVTKLVGSPPGTELYAVAAASDAPLPPSTARIVLGTGLEHEEQRQLTELWRDRAIHAEAAAAAIRTEMHFVLREQRKTLAHVQGADDAVARVAALDAQVIELSETLEACRRGQAALVDSASWRLTRPLRGLKRVLRRGPGDRGG